MFSESLWFKSQVALPEPGVAQRELEGGVDAGVLAIKAGVGDVHVLRLQRPGVAMIAGVEVEARAALRREVHVVRVERNVMVGDQQSAGEFEERADAIVATEVPYEDSRFELDAGGVVTVLPDVKKRQEFGARFEVATQPAGAVLTGEPERCSRSSSVPDRSRCCCPRIRRARTTNHSRSTRRMPT